MRVRRRGEIEAEAKLLAAERFAAVGRLAAGAAYELEAPLSRVLVHVRAALEALESGEDIDARGVLHEALDGAHHVEETVRGLKAFTAASEATGAIDVHESLELAIQVTREVVGGRATLVRQYAAVPRVSASFARLTRAFVCLLRNAAESIPPGNPHANGIAIRTAIDDGMVSIEIADTGTGIEPEDVPYVFDPFFTTKPRASSPGLGLTVARAVVAELGGAVALESIVGRGSRFTVTLPASAAPGEHDLPLYVRETPPTRRILCVAASSIEAQRLGQALDDGDATLTHATLEDALERLALGEAYDLVVCEPRAASAGNFRARLRHVAPETLARTFDLSLRSGASGLFTKVA